MRQKMIKRLPFFFCVVVLYSTQTWGQTWNMSPTMIATLDSNGVLTISTTKSEGEAMPDYPLTSQDMPWFDVRTKVFSVVIKDRVTSIGNSVFETCNYLSSITIPNSVTSIGEYAFWACHRLTTIDIPNTVITIGGYAFLECNSITSIFIPKSVKVIGEGAFSGCSGLTSIILSNSIERIEWFAFQNCIALTDVTVDWTTPLQVPNDVFDGVNTSLLTLKVPTGTKALYQVAPVWKDFGTIKENQQTQELVPYLYIEKTDRNVLEILFADSEIRMQDDLFLVITPYEQYMYNYKEIDNFSFKLKYIEITSNEKVLMSSSVQVYLDDAGILHISNNQPLRYIAIYNITGQLLKSFATNETETTINISGFAKGIYLVKTYNKTVKIIK